MTRFRYKHYLGLKRAFLEKENHILNKEISISAMTIMSGMLDSKKCCENNLTRFSHKHYLGLKIAYIEKRDNLINGVSI